MRRCKNRLVGYWSSCAQAACMQRWLQQKQQLTKRHLRMLEQPS